MAADNGVQARFFKRGFHCITDLKTGLQTTFLSLPASLGKHGHGEIEAEGAVAELACNESYEPRAGSYIEHVSRRWRQMSFNGSNPRLVFGALQAGHVAWIRIIKRCDGTPEGGDAFLHIAVVRGS